MNLEIIPQVQRDIAEAAQYYRGRPGSMPTSSWKLMRQ